MATVPGVSAERNPGGNASAVVRVTCGAGTLSLAEALQARAPVALPADRGEAGQLGDAESLEDAPAAGAAEAVEVRRVRAASADGCGGVRSELAPLPTPEPTLPTATGAQLLEGRASLRFVPAPETLFSAPRRTPFP